MNKIRIVTSTLLPVILAVSVLGQNQDFYDRVLDDTGNERNSYFISFEVKSKGYEGDVVVTNGSWELYLTRSRRYNHRSYKQFMSDLITNKKSIELKKVRVLHDGDFLRIGGPNHVDVMPVKQQEEVREIARKGCDAVVRHYFESVSGGSTWMLKRNRGMDEENAIIHQLFQWRIPSRIGDYSGMLMIMSEDFRCSTG